MYKKRNNRIWVLTFFFSTIIVNLSIGLQVNAAGLNFDVKIVTPKNQLDKKKTYFDLLVNRGETQELQYVITNQIDDEIVLDIIPTIATTNNDGEVSFSEVDKTRDSTLKYALTDLVSKQQRIYLKAKESKEITFKLSIPDSGIEGKVVGGFLFKEVSKDKEQVESKGITITNNFVLVKGIELQEKKNKFNSNIDIKEIKAQLVNNTPKLTINIQNTIPNFERSLNVDVKVKREKKNEVIYSKNSQNINMAPNSNFDFEINLDEDSIVEGFYRADITITGNGFQKKEVKNFEITSDSIENIKVNTISMKPKKKTWLLVFSFVVIGIFFILIMLVLKRKMHRQ